MTEALAAAGTDLILIDGLAIAFWLHHYKLSTSPTHTDRVIFWGYRKNLELLAARLKTSAEFPDPRSATALAGSLHKVFRGRIVRIDVVHTISGLDELNDEKSAVRVPFEQTTIRVLDPVSLIATKLISLRHFNRPEQDDRNHLKAAIEIARFFIADAFRKKGIPCGLSYCKRLLDIASIRSNQQTIKENSVPIFDAIPMETIDALRLDPKLAEGERQRLLNFLHHIEGRLRGSV